MRKGTAYGILGAIMSISGLAMLFALVDPHATLNGYGAGGYGLVFSGILTVAAAEILDYVEPKEKSE